MAYDQATTYETIELFGLTEKDASLPIPQDDILKDCIIREAFETLLGQLRNTGLEGEIEPIAHGLATILQRRKVALGKEVDRTADKIGALAKCHDGSEIAETALEEAQARFVQLREIVDAIETMGEAAAECYEVETGNAFIPASGSRASVRAQETGAVFEARQLLEQHDSETAAKSKVEGVPLIVSGARAVQYTVKSDAERQRDTAVPVLAVSVKVTPAEMAAFDVVLASAGIETRSEGLRRLMQAAGGTFVADARLAAEMARYRASLNEVGNGVAQIAKQMRRANREGQGTEARTRAEFSELRLAQMRGLARFILDSADEIDLLVRRRRDAMLLTATAALREFAHAAE